MSRHRLTDRHRSPAVLVTAVLSLLLCLLQPLTLSFAGTASGPVMTQRVTAPANMADKNCHSVAAHHEAAHHSSGQQALCPDCEFGHDGDHLCLMNHYLPGYNPQQHLLAVFLLLAVALLPRLITTLRGARFLWLTPPPCGPRLHLRLCVQRD